MTGDNDRERTAAVRFRARIKRPWLCALLCVLFLPDLAARWCVRLHPDANQP